MKFLKMILVMTSVQFIISCKDSPSPQKRSTNPPLKPAMTETQLLENAGRNIIAPTVLKAQVDNAILGGQIEALCTQLEKEEPYTDALGNAQVAWRLAMETHHLLEAVTIGPAFENGRKLIDNLYSWPYINPCGVDHQVVKLANSGEINSALNSSLKGLGALEYLLFSNANTTACNLRSPTTKPILEWSKKSEREKLRNRCAYSRQIVQELIAQSKELARVWSPTLGDYTKTFTDGSRHPDSKSAINALSDALFAVETLKDQRLGKVLGLHKDCTAENRKCPELAEHPWSGFALMGIEAQLKQFRELFKGGDGVGFDDYLDKMGKSHVSTDILQRADTVLDSLQSLKRPNSLQQQVTEMDSQQCFDTTSTNRLVPVCALFRDLQALCRVLKTDFLIALSLKAPPVFQGDND